METLGVALIGAGYWGRNYAKDLAALEDVNLKYVVDKNPEAAANLELRGVNPSLLTSDLEQVLADEEIKGVFIVTPAASHAELGKRALYAGKHVFLEKPMAPTVEECEALIRAEHESKRLLCVGHQYVHHPIIELIKREYIDTGRLGAIQAMHFVRDGPSPVRPDVDCMWDLAPHDLSIALYCGTSSPTLVRADGRTTHGASVGRETTTQMILDTDQYPITVRSSNTGGQKQRVLSIQGEYYTVVFDETAEDPTKRFQVLETPHTEGRPSIYEPGDLSEALNSQCLAIQTARFVDWMRAYPNCRPITNSVFGMQVVQLLEAADKSKDHGGLEEISTGFFVGGGEYRRAPRLEIVQAVEEKLPEDVNVGHSGGLSLNAFEHHELVQQVSKRLPEDREICHLVNMELEDDIFFDVAYSPFSIHDALCKPPSHTNLPFYRKVPERKKLADNYGVLPISAMSLVLTEDNKVLFGKRVRGTATKGNLSLVASGFQMANDGNLFTTSQRSFEEELGIPSSNIGRKGYHGLTYADTMNRGFGAAISLDCALTSEEIQHRFLEHKADILEKIALHGGQPSGYVFTRVEAVPFNTEDMENYILANRASLDMHSVGAALLVARNRLHLGPEWFDRMVHHVLPDNYGRVLVHENEVLAEAESAKQFVLDTNSKRFLTRKIEDKE